MSKHACIYVQIPQITHPFLPFPIPLTDCSEKKEQSISIDFAPLVSANGEALLCHACHKNSEPTSPNASWRTLICCSVCSTPWHLDCLDPPLTVPPVVRTWRCPLHAEHDIDRFSFLYPAHRNRQLKNASPVLPVYSRGMKNNGLIDIIDDIPLLARSTPKLIARKGRPRSRPEPDSTCLTTEVPLDPLACTYPDPESFGRVHQLRASTIALDTIERQVVHGNPVLVFFFLFYFRARAALSNISQAPESQ